jgi:hypothetical protein
MQNFTDDLTQFLLFIIKYREKKIEIVKHC